jgi:conjugal transfer mating pair stabilization protein TraG
MAGTYIVHTYFNQDEYVAMLNAIVMICGGTVGGGDYTMLVKTIALIGLLSVMLFGIWRARGEDAVSYVIAFAIIYSCLFIPRVSVVVQDHELQLVNAKAPQVVDNVPIGLAFFLTTTSQIGYWLTNKFEATFSLPEPLSYSNVGLMGGSRILREIANTKMSPMLANDISMFMMYCVNPEIIAASHVTGLTPIQTILDSPDIWSTIGISLNPGRVVSLKEQNSVMFCTGGPSEENAYAYLTNRLSGATVSNAKKVADRVFPGLGSSAAPYLLSVIPQAETIVYNASSSALTSIRQGMMINLLNEHGTNMSQILNDPTAALTALGASQAASSANASFRVSAELAKQSLPFVHNIIELIIVGIFPIVFLLIVAAGPKAGFVIKNYILVLLWVQLWAPIYAIVNYIGMMQVARNAKGSLQGIEGLAISNAANIHDTLISGEAIAGMMTGLVVTIAFAVLKGGEVAMSGLVQSITRPAESAAQQAGSAAGSGKIDMGSVNWGSITAHNANANQTNFAGSYKSGFNEVESPYGKYRQLPGADFGLTPVGGGLGGEISTSGSNTQQGQIGSGSATTRTEALVNSFMRQTGANYGDTETAQKQKQVSDALKDTFGTTLSEGNREALAREIVAGNADVIRRVAAITREMALSGSAKANTPGGGGSSGGGVVPTTNGTPAQSADASSGSSPNPYTAGIPAENKGLIQSGKDAIANAGKKVNELGSKLARFVGVGVNAGYSGQVGQQEQVGSDTSATSSTKHDKNWQKAEEASQSLEKALTETNSDSRLRALSNALTEGANRSKQRSLGLNKTQDSHDSQVETWQSARQFASKHNAAFEQYVMDKLGIGPREALKVAYENKDNIMGKLADSFVAEKLGKPSSVIGYEHKPHVSQDDLAKRTVNDMEAFDATAQANVRAFHEKHRAELDQLNKLDYNDNGFDKAKWHKLGAERARIQNEARDEIAKGENFITTRNGIQRIVNDDVLNDYLVQHVNGFELGETANTLHVAMAEDDVVDERVRSFAQPGYQMTSKDYEFVADILNRKESFYESAWNSAKGAVTKAKNYITGNE